MANSMKPYEVPLEQSLAQEILNIPLPPGEHEIPHTIGQRISQAVQAVEDANRFLATSALAGIVARQLMLDLKKRGNPSIVVKPDGTVTLRITYGEKKIPSTSRDMVQPVHRPDLPTLAKLREEAAEIGIDISDLGRKRRAIFNRIQESKSRLRGPLDEVSISPVPAT